MNSFDARYTLEDFASMFYCSADWLRSIARDDCGIACENTELVDLWLYVQLTKAAKEMGPHFSMMLQSEVLQSLTYSLSKYQGTFLEKCAASFAELVADPTAFTELVADPTVVDYIALTKLTSSERPLRIEGDGGAFNESFSDFLVFTGEWRS